MSRTVDVDQRAPAQATGIVRFPQTTNSTNTVKKIPTRGHYDWTLTTIVTGAGGTTAILKGTNNEDPTDTSGEVLITNTHVAAGQQDGSAANKGYKYVFVHVTALTQALGRVIVFGTGFAGTE